MKNRRNRLVAASLVLLTLAGCGSDLTKSASPLALIASTSQTLTRIDVLQGAANCDQAVGTINLQVVVKNPNLGTENTAFQQVRISRYRVSYVRTDGGKQVPAPFDRTMDSLLSVGSTSTLNNFLILQSEALNQAPFVALRTNNGGKDPDTGLSVVRMNVIVEIFGETLGGDDVAATTTFPLEFCYSCGGCS